MRYFGCKINTTQTVTQLFLHNIPYKNRANILKIINRNDFFCELL